MMKYDVAVVGAGPAGATAARFLSKSGLTVTLVEKEQLPRDKPCGGALSVHHLKRFNYIDDKCGEIEVLGSFAEVEEKSGMKLTDPHKPFVDEIKYKCSKCNGQMARVNDVIDVWYDSGSMPFARFHYPFENTEKFKEKYPAEFIAEGVDQTRGWFYTLHVLGTALFDHRAYNNVIVNGLALASDGSKMSKSKKNYKDVDIIINQFGADAIRLYFSSSPIVAGQEVVFDEKSVKEVVASVMLLYWNSVKYLISYSDQFNWKPSGNLNSEDVMDRWLISRLQETTQIVTENLDKYLIQKSSKAISDLIDDTSKWYIRRSRDRFVEGNADALETLNYVLLEISKLIAPFAPFLSESVYQSLMKGDSLESVHLEEYPKFEKELLDESLIKEMFDIREICSEGLKIRDENKLKLRQPLAKAYVAIKNETLREIVKSELNLKEIEFSQQEVKGESLITMGKGSQYITIDTNITKDLLNECYCNDFVRQYQNSRKEVDDINYGDNVELFIGVNDKDMQEILSDYLSKNSRRLYIENFEFSTEIGEGKFELGDFEVSIKVEKI